MDTVSQETEEAPPVDGDEKHILLLDNHPVTTMTTELYLQRIDPAVRIAVYGSAEAVLRALPTRRWHRIFWRSGSPGRMGCRSRSIVAILSMRTAAPSLPAPIICVCGAGV